MKFNEELARKALGRIKANPTEWNQRTWRCSTGMCFAGFVAFAAGARWADTDPESWDDTVIGPDGENYTVQEFASKNLDYDGFELYDEGNDMDDLEYMINNLSNP